MTALATMFGLVPAADLMDMRGLRVRTPEMEAYMCTRHALFSHATAVLFRDLRRDDRGRRQGQGQGQGQGAGAASAIAAPLLAVLASNVLPGEAGRGARGHAVAEDAVRWVGSAPPPQYPPRAVHTLLEPSIPSALFYCLV